MPSVQEDNSKMNINPPALSTHNSIFIYLSRYHINLARLGPVAPAGSVECCRIVPTTVPRQTYQQDSLFSI